MKKLGNYEIVKCIGATELTMLYLAQHRYLGKDLVIEASPVENDGELQQRLKFMAQLLGKLKHPKILTIVDAFEDGKMMYLVFEWSLEWQSLEQILRREERLDLDSSLKLSLEACQVLAFLHDQGVVHQNLQPQNFLLGENSFCIGGFTLANTLENPFTGGRQKLGDSRYASPEWFLREPVCKEQDIWGLGVCLYRMLSGKFPFEGDANKEVGEYVIEGNFKALSEILPGVPKCIEEIIHRMLSRKKEDRPSLKEIISTLEGQLYMTPVANAFIAMPFHPHFNRVYHAIRNVCQEKRVKPIRVDENLLPANIWQDIEHGIQESTFVIADLSPVPGPEQTNPNVAFEVGMAHSLGKPTVLLTQEIESLPFDFKQQRSLVYENQAEKISHLEQKLREVIAFLLDAKRNK